MITKITPEQANEIIETREPLGKFYTIEKVDDKRIYVGIDNEYGDAWTEDFESLGACKRWLEG